MKFNYTNSSGEEACYEVTPLTNELYKKILEEDRNLLLNISQKKNTSFNSEEYVLAATEMLEGYGKGKDSNFSKPKDENVLVGITTNKKIIKKAEGEAKTKSQTPKAVLRKQLSSNQIRMFKKDKMTIVLDQEKGK
jgi:hypothetical protein